MKRFVLAGLAGSAALLAATAANAVTFTYSGQIDSYTVQTSAWYEIDAWGAQGGSFFAVPNSGGLGAMVGGRIYLDAGQTLDIVVGGQGRGDINGNTGAGGGGGSFVFFASDLDLLLAAGGGGGASWNGNPGGPGLAGSDGGGSGGGVDGMGGAAGAVAGDDHGAAGGGAGWLGPGASGATGIHGSGGALFQGGGTSGCTILPECESGPSGGFGGGGGASYNDGGGGGGYSGGGGGGYDIPAPGGFPAAGGGGGGSYIADGFNDIVAQSGVNAGSGKVTIDPIAMPEPGTWAMMLLGFFGLGAMLRRRRPIMA